jgi:hypothetical protein
MVMQGVSPPHVDLEKQAQQEEASRLHYQNDMEQPLLQHPPS